MFQDYTFANEAEVLKKGHWIIRDWDIRLVVLSIAGDTESYQPSQLMVLALGTEDEVLATNVWPQTTVATFADVCLVLRNKAYKSLGTTTHYGEG